jgi:hypothetical protein
MGFAITGRIADVSSRGAFIGVLIAVAAAPSLAATAPPTRDPQDAVAIVKRILNRHMKACRLDWARVDAEGFEGNWNIDVKIRASRAGKGIARWHIGTSWPIARNKLAKAIVHDCPR